MREMRNANKILVLNSEGRDHSKGLGIGGRKIKMNLGEIWWV
jgi:hypothetical protein